MKESQAFKRIASACIVAVLVMDRAEDAVPVAEALLAGGITAMELTLRTPAALDALCEIKRAVPEIVIRSGDWARITAAARVAVALRDHEREARPT